MNNKQKFGYTILGAVIMIVGMGIGAIVSPNLIAQSDEKSNHFDHVTCRSLLVVDKDGKLAIGLATTTETNTVHVYNKDGKLAIDLSAENGINIVRVYDDQGEGVIGLHHGSKLGGTISILSPQGRFGIIMRSSEKSNNLEIYNPPENSTGIKISLSESHSKISIDGQVGEESILLATDAKIDPFIAITNRSGKVKWYSD